MPTLCHAKRYIPAVFDVNQTRRFVLALAEDHPGVAAGSQAAGGKRVSYHQDRVAALLAPPPLPGACYLAPLKRQQLIQTSLELGGLVQLFTHRF